MQLPAVHPIIEARDAAEAPTPRPAVVAVDLVKTYGSGEAAVTALGGVSASFTAGRFSAIMGPSGSGKSTLLHCLAGRRLDRDWLDGIVRTLRLGDRLRHRPSELSGGQQQRVAIAGALVTHPVVVFADEPTGNLDSRAGQELLGLLRHSVTELGQTIVMVTHDPVAASHADGVLFLADGCLAGELEKPTVSAVLDRLGGPEAGR
jgi:putative ABC transport system ATP-binding protein